MFLTEELLDWCREFRKRSLMEVEERRRKMGEDISLKPDFSKVAPEMLDQLDQMSEPEIRGCMRMPHHIPEHNYPFSRDWGLDYIKCSAESCICNRDGKCIIPSMCKIGDDGRCVNFKVKEGKE